ncbi:MAG TPA: DUF2851 family protein [Flavobacterium sp.]|nr:DUF2851 family protein [Flavobacterium sp.]
MKEDFLHYLWKFRKFDASNLHTFHKEPIAILNPGQYLQLAGPDFFNAKIIIGKQQWAGNVEIHIKSSDWYLHHHEKDDAYDNVILHVVWEHDTEIFRKDNTEIPVLELRHYVASETLCNYETLMFPKSWIFCERQLSQVDPFVFGNWQERLFFERLERKSKFIEELLTQTNQDWEAVLFYLLARNFGLNTNGEIFFKAVRSIPFSVIRKERVEVENLEALLFGNAGLLDGAKEDHYFHSLKSRFSYLSGKYKLEENSIGPVQFFKHRPDNFPTIRLSQLAGLYFQQKQLFSDIADADSVKAIYGLFDVSVSQYWQTHYQFDRESPKKMKSLSKAFIDLIVINTIVPVRFAYAKSLGKGISEKLIYLLQQIAAESNAIVTKFDSFGIRSANAFETQALLQLKTDYCNNAKCLECAIGMELLKQPEIEKR